MIELSDIVAKFNLRALAVIGSRARDDHSEHSDLDLIGLASEESFQRFCADQLVIELHIAPDVLHWAIRPSWWYALSGLKIHLDDGTLSTLPNLIKKWRNTYSVPIADIKRNRDWLESVVRKLNGSSSERFTAFLLATSNWEILAGVFIKRNIPVPANSDMYRLAPELIGKDLFDGLLVGSFGVRKKIALELCDKILKAHNKSLQSTPNGKAVDRD